MKISTAITTLPVLAISVAVILFFSQLTLPIRPGQPINSDTRLGGVEAAQAKIDADKIESDRIKVEADKINARYQ